MLEAAIERVTRALVSSAFEFSPELVAERRAMREELAEASVSDAQLAARTMHAMIGLTDREHFAALFLNVQHDITGAHVVAIGGQHGIGTIEARTVFRAAITACATAVILSHYAPRRIMAVLLPPPLRSPMRANRRPRRR